MRQQNKKTPLVFRVGVTLLCIVMLFSHLTGGIYARYTATASGSDSARVAKFEVRSDLKEQTTDLVLDLTNIKPGYIEEINLQVTNCSEVAVSYKFTVESLENIPLTFEFSPSYEGQFLLGNTQTATHTLIISWPEAKNDVKFASEIDIVTIVLTCTQID